MKESPREKEKNNNMEKNLRQWIGWVLKRRSAQ
jgi:hypothetical protein